MAISPPTGAGAPPANPVNNPSIDDSHLSATQFSIDEVRDLFLGHHGTWEDDRSRSAEEKAVLRQWNAKAVAIISQPASVPREHEGRSLPKTTSVQPPPRETWLSPVDLGSWLPSEDAARSTRNRKICYRFVSAISCNLKGSSFMHEHMSS